MAKTTTILYTCAKCDAQHPKWAGQCTTCGAWGTVNAQQSTAAQRVPVSGIRVREEDAPLLDAVTSDDAACIPTGIAEFDAAVGGGIVRGALLLLAGEPGIGKSTLVLQVAGAVASLSPSRAKRDPESSRDRGRVVCPAKPEGRSGGGGDVLYVTGEETAAQLRQRAARVGAAETHIRVLATTDARMAAAAIAQRKPALAIVDSIQTLSNPDLPVDAGGVTQVRMLANMLLQTAKATGVPIIAVGHVTKDGAVAGPKTLEHLVDQVAVFEGDPTSDFRILRTTKNRYGPTDVAGVFTMTERGLAPCPDPAAAFLATSSTRTPGSAIAVTAFGNRAILAEVQALVSRSAVGMPQRRAVGVDANRLHVLLAVLASHGGLALGTVDVHVATVGGLRLDDPGTDLAVAAALVSAARGAPLPFDALIGEVGLNGAIRPVRGIERRIREAVRIGRTRIALPPCDAKIAGTRATTITTIRDLIKALPT